MNEQALDWNDYRLVLAVGRAGSLNGAAKRLGISHATVFRRVNAIERALGVRLFERARDGYALTPAGEDATAVAAELEARIADVERRLAGHDERPAGSVRVATTDTLLFGPLPPLIAAFRQQHPGIVLEFAAGNSLANLSRREADVALRPSADPPGNLIGRRIARVAFAVYAAKRQRHVDPDADAWVVPDDSLSHLRLARWIAERGHDSRAAFRANGLVALRDAAAQGLGLAVLPCYLGDISPGLARVGAPIAELDNELWLLTHPDLRRVARVRTFLDAMRDALTTQRDLFEGRRPGAQSRDRSRTG
jgi:molybdate transport repressor ModE-like protein